MPTQEARQERAFWRLASLVLAYTELEMRFDDIGRLSPIAACEARDPMSAFSAGAALG
ncbi:hypothetical protein [Paraburkholderia unamae]|uniref:Uncharacterized protein n=1 Tax=Paraburkholderia unamae TaxID=219649 RepID=A0ACC6RFS1_9BURK